MGDTWYKRGLFGPIQNIESVSLLILNDAIEFQTFVSKTVYLVFLPMSISGNESFIQLYIFCFKKLLLSPTEFASVASGESCLKVVS